MANDSDFGLHGAVFTRDLERGFALAGRIRSGTLALNGYGITAVGPFGGVKSSGWGREMGPEGMEEFYELKSTSLDSTAADWYRNRRSEEHTSELQSLMRISYAVFCVKKKK